MMKRLSEAVPVPSWTIAMGEVLLASAQASSGLLKGVRYMHLKKDIMRLESGFEVSRAKYLATQAHAGQVDKLGAPYIEHCERVASMLVDSDAKTVAWLHDVLEDTATTEQGLRGQFSSSIVDAIVAITHLPNERNTIYWQRVKSNELARRVKIADIYDNSDPRRLALLDAATAKRLVLKYERALEVLKMT